MLLFYKHHIQKNYSCQKRMRTGWRVWSYCPTGASWSSLRLQLERSTWWRTLCLCRPRCSARVPRTRPRPRSPLALGNALPSPPTRSALALRPLPVRAFSIFWRKHSLYHVNYILTVYSYSVIRREGKCTVLILIPHFSCILYTFLASISIHALYWIVHVLRR